MALSLDDIKARMTEEQRRDMAEIVANEVKRRESMSQQRPSGARPAQKSNVRSSRMTNALPSEALGEMYSGLEEKVSELRKQKLDQQIADTRALSQRAAAPRNPFRSPRLFSSTSLLVVGVVTLGLLKVAISSGIIGQSSSPQSAAGAIPVEAAAPVGDVPQQVASAPEGAQSADAERKVPGTWSVAEKQVLTELDARRVELEKRRQELDQREGEIKNQAQALSERIAELRTLVTKVSQIRKEKDNQYEARLEQLSNVYGSMAPNEAAPLVSKLDEDTALSLLKRMPGKRMGQILSLMEPERAVRLTKLLSDKSTLDEVPAQ